MIAELRGKGRWCGLFQRMSSDTQASEPALLLRQDLLVSRESQTSAKPALVCDSRLTRAHDIKLSRRLTEGWAPGWLAARWPPSPSWSSSACPEPAARAA